MRAAYHQVICEVAEAVAAGDPEHCCAFPPDSAVRVAVEVWVLVCLSCYLPPSR